jgi:hypothetical protein
MRTGVLSSFSSFKSGQKWQSSRTAHGGIHVTLSLESSSRFTSIIRLESSYQSQSLVLYSSDDKEPPLAQLHSPFQATKIAKECPTHANGLKCF